MSGKIWAATNVQCRYINAKQHSSVSDFDIYIIFNASLSVCFIFTTRIKTGCSILCPLIQHLLLENHSEKSKAARSVFVYLCICVFVYLEPENHSEKSKAAARSVF